jgi:hypothetical protein
MPRIGKILVLIGTAGRLRTRLCEHDADATAGAERRRNGRRGRGCVGGDRRGKPGPWGRRWRCGGHRDRCPVG